MAKTYQHALAFLNTSILRTQGVEELERNMIWVRDLVLAQKPDYRVVGILPTAPGRTVLGILLEREVPQGEAASEPAPEA